MSAPTPTATRPPDCPHELRPGTTVCLLCRHAARVQAQRRRHRLFARVGAAGLALGVVVVLVVAATSSLRDRRAASVARGATMADTPAATPSHAAHDSTLVVAPRPPITEPAPTTTHPVDAMPVSSSPSVVATAAAATPPRLTPIIAEGRSELSDSMFAVRSGDTVRVVFDHVMTRTRRPEKFERIVRETLPAVYGPAADTALASIRAGTLTGQADLLGELPTRGVEIPLASGRTLSLWPETRQGRDGPLVVTYRAVVRR